MTGYFNRVKSLTPTTLWVNNVTLEQARLGQAAGAVGATQNPAHLSKVLTSEDGQWLMPMMDEILQEGLNDTDTVAELQRRAVARICNEFLGLYQRTGGRQGFVSIQADPFHEDAANIIDNAEKSLALADNFIIKIPVTEDGLVAIGELARRGIPLLATEVMSMDQVRDVIDEYEAATSNLKNPAPLIIAHINGIFDEYMAETAKAQGISVQPDALAQAALMLGRKINEYIRNADNPHVFYMAGGARGLHHFTHWVGARGAVTINWKGTADKLVEQDPQVLDVFNAPSPSGYVDELISKLEDYAHAWTPGSLARKDYEHFGPVVKFRRQFEDGWTDALKAVQARRQGKK